MEDPAKTTQVDLDGFDLSAIIAGLDHGVFTSQYLVETYLARIAQLDDQVRAMACINPDAKMIAAERDQQRKNGEIMGILHGVPLVLKDVFVTDDKMDTTGGSYALVGAKFAEESSVVSRIRAAGGIILGKTNLSQWGMSRSPKCPSGWTALFGQALGGFHVSQDPQGSSSGSAIAASLNFASAAIGAETCGSILYPAARNGVVGLKPTVGLTSRAGVIPLNPEQDSVGPLTRQVKDSAIILQVIAGKDERDKATTDIPFDDVPDYVAACTETGLQGIRIVVPQSVYKVADSDPEVAKVFREAIETIRSLGATVIDDVDFEIWKPGSGLREDLAADIMLREAFEDFFGRLVENPQKIANISDLIDFIKERPEEQYEKFGADWFENARDAPGSPEPEDYLKTKAKMEHLGEDVVRLLDKHNCDVLLATSSTDLPLDLGRLPGISVPLGFYSAERPVVRNSKGLVTKGPNIPFAVTFAGRRFSEETLISCAYAFEQATKVAQRNEEKLRVRPTLLDSDGGSPCGKQAVTRASGSL
ncbi:amidase [Cordyceps javanica]|uniref:Amidase n=1 Tax=Cordyceps javanica TaxID=43265 RepID=A0A545V6L8_9HYPO|nr:amidase [Cordyceps javanica]TQW08580.1 amidase [Cordyceps javanica]